MKSISIAALIFLALPEIGFSSEDKYVEPSNYSNDDYVSKLNGVYDESFVHNTVFGEVLGNGIVLSLNYERYLSRDFGLRLGIGSLFGSGRTVPLMFNYYRGKRYRLELGLGAVYLPLWKEDGPFGKEGSFLWSSTIGLKFEPVEGGIMIRLSLTPFYDPSQHSMHFWGGFSVGVAF